MTEKIGIIKNPLTIIALFAGIAEVSGTVVLPLIQDANQSVYMWFLMVFPVLLVLIFFITLNFNHRVLYAPSDFKDDDSFLKLFTKANPAEVEKKKISKATEMEKAENQPIPKSATQSPHASIEGKQNQFAGLTSPRALYTFAEDLALRQLSLEYNFPVEKEVEFRGRRHRYVFDGIIRKELQLIGIEVKFMRSDRAGLRILEPALHKLQQIYEDMPENQRSRFNFILAIVVQDTSNNNQLKILNDLRSRFDFPLEIRIFNLEQLRKSFETGDN